MEWREVGGMMCGIEGGWWNEVCGMESRLN